MTRSTTLPARGLATLALAATLVACSDGLLATDLTPDFAKLNGTNGFELFQVAFPDDEICAGSPIVWTELSGHLKVASVTPRQGGGVVVREIMSNGRITLSAGGKTLSSTMSGQAFYDIDANDDLVSITFVGNNGAFTAPGMGRIIMEVGTLVLGPGGVLLERGQHDVFGSNPDVAKLCAYLGG
ncbi:hypothetical protein BH23GEM3_BH23GEM3_10370 [soil metagenome]